MAKIRNPLAQDKTAALKGNAARAAEKFSEHRKVCYACRPGEDFPKRACERGWNLVKEATRAANTLSVAQGNSAGATMQGQGQLW